MKLTTILLLGISASTLFACQNAHEAKPAATPLVQSPAPNTNTSPGKPRGPVAVTHRFLEQPALNAPLKIELSLNTAVPAKAIKLAYRVDGQLTSVDANHEVSFQPITRDQQYTHVIQVVPMADGLHQVMLDVSLITVDDQTHSSTVVIPVSIGDKKAFRKPEHPNNAYIQQDDKGQPIITLPAQESRH